MFDSKDYSFAVVLLYIVVGSLFVSAVFHAFSDTHWLFPGIVFCSFSIFFFTDISRVFVVYKVKLMFFIVLTVLLMFSLGVSYLFTCSFFIWVLFAFSFFYWYWFIFELFNYFYGFYPCYRPSQRHIERFSHLFNRYETDEDKIWTVFYIASFVAILVLIKEFVYLR